MSTQMTPAGMSQPAEVMAWLLSRLDAGTYDEVTGWQRDVADLDYEGTTRDGRSEPVALPEPSGVPGALELGAWLDESTPQMVEVPASTLLRLADQIDRWSVEFARSTGHGLPRIGVESELRALATQPEQRAERGNEREGRNT